MEWASCSFVNNVATGDFGGGIAAGSSGWQPKLAITNTQMRGNFAPLGGSAIFVKSVEMVQSRRFEMADSNVVRSALDEQSVIHMQDIPHWSLHSVQLTEYTSALVVADTTSVDCMSASLPQCAGGYSCSMVNASILCTPCVSGTISTGRAACSSCSSGRGPTAQQDGCTDCTGDSYSSAGICKPCPLELVVGTERESCVSCPNHQTAVNSTVLQVNVSSQSKRLCGCEREYVNTSVALHVCFSSGFDATKMSNAQEDHQRLARHNQCQLCPSDQLGEACLECLDGISYPAAGFTMVPKHGTSRSVGRRRIQRADGTNLEVDYIKMFRCHTDLDVARRRCPRCKSPPCGCAEGFDGFLCGSCAEEPSVASPHGFGMSDGECKECEGNYPGWIVWLAAMGVTAVLGGLFGIVAQACRQRWIQRIKPLAKSVWVPVKIAVVYCQVISQLENVLDFKFPGLLGDLIDILQPIIILPIKPAFRYLGVHPLECFGIRSYTIMWILQICGLPFMLAVLVGGNYLYETRKVANHSKASLVQSPSEKAKSYAALGVFMYYPTWVKTSFDVFLCRAISDTQSVLQLDDRVMCEDASHQALQAVAVIVIIACLILPIVVLVKLWQARRQFLLDVEHGQHADDSLITRVARDMDVAERDAKWIIGDVTICSATGEGWHVLADGYMEGFEYWEAVSPTCAPLACSARCRRHFESDCQGAIGGHDSKATTGGYGDVG